MTQVNGRAAYLVNVPAIDLIKNAPMNEPSRDGGFGVVAGNDLLAEYRPAPRVASGEADGEFQTTLAAWPVSTFSDDRAFRQTALPGQTALLEWKGVSRHSKILKI